MKRLIDQRRHAMSSNHGWESMRSPPGGLKPQPLQNFGFLAIKVCHFETFGALIYSLEGTFP